MHTRYLCAKMNVMHVFVARYMRIIIQTCVVETATRIPPYFGVADRMAMVACFSVLPDTIRKCPSCGY